MSKRVLIDTNILIYVYDARDRVRQERAVTLIHELRTASAGYLSVKTLAELFVVLSRIPNPFTADDAIQEMKYHASVWPVFDLTPSIAIEAARVAKWYSFSYWDAQIWATAKTHQMDAVFTEDMNTGAVYEGVHIINPLLETFDLESWLHSG